MSSKSVSTLGVTSKALAILLSRVHDEYGDSVADLTSERIVAEIISPCIDSHTMSFAELLLVDINTAQSDAADYVGEATVFVSHAWKCPIVELLDTLIRYTNDRDERTYFWLDVCCSNQHLFDHVSGNAQSRLPWAWYQTAIASVVRNCTQLVVVATPFTNPEVCKRAWCLFEAATASLHHVPITMAVPQSEVQTLKNEIERNADVIGNMMRAINSKNAVAAVPEDLEKIRAMIEAIDGGYQTLDDVFTSNLQKWITDKGQLFVARAPDGTRTKASLAQQMGCMMIATGNNDSAIAFLSQALVIWGSALENEKLNESSTLAAIGTAYKNKGEYGRAINFYSRALALQETEFGKHDRSTLGTLMGLGSAHMQRGNYAEAVEFYEKSLVGKRATLGEFHEDTAQTYMGLGSAYKYMGNFAKAIRNYTEALNIQLNVLGNEHPDTADTCMGLGSAQMQMGQYDNAVGFYLKSLEIKRKVWGFNHAKTALTYMGLGSVYMYKNELDKSIDAYMQALQIELKVFNNSDHPDIAQTYMGLGSAYMRKEQLDEAIEFYTKSLDIKLELLGTYHADTAATYTGLGSAFLKKGEYNKALEYYNKALDINTRVLGEDHCEIGQVLMGLGSVYLNLGDNQKSMAMYEQSYDNMCKALGKEHPQPVNLKRYMDSLQS